MIGDETGQGGRDSDGVGKMKSQTQNVVRRRVQVPLGVSWILSAATLTGLLAISFWAVDEWTGDVPYWFQIFLPGLALVSLWRFAGSDWGRTFWGVIFIQGKKVWLFFILTFAGLAVIGGGIVAAQYYLEMQQERAAEVEAERRQFLLKLGIRALEIDAPAPEEDSGLVRRVSENDAIKAISLSPLLEDASRVEKTKSIARNYEASQSKAGKPLFENHKRRHLVAGYDYRVNFQDRNRHGLEGEALRSVAQAFSNDNEANKGFFVRRFISATFQISPKNLYDNTQEWLDAFARVEFGEAGLDEVEIFDRLGTRFDMEDEAILLGLGLGLGLDNVNPNEVKQELHREFHYEEARISRLGFDVAVAVRKRLDPYRDDMNGWRDSGKDGISKEETARLRNWLKEIPLTDLGYVVECLGRDSPPALGETVDKIVDKEFSELL